MNKTLLETVNLKKSYNHNNGTITIFTNFNFKIKEGELVALVGPSGSGKSSLLHLLALLDEPSKGQIIINKEDTKSLSDAQKDELRRKNVSIIFQDNNLLTDFTAIENIMMPLIINGETINLASEKAKKLLKSVKISNRSNHFPNELSGGEQQRVAIARALISDTKIILADEPTGNLDTENSDMISKILFRYVKEEGSSLIMVTHDPKLANRASRKIKIKDGKIK